MTVYNYGKFQAGGEWRTPSVFYMPYIEAELVERVNTGDALIGIDSIVELVAGGGDRDDLRTATICGDESKVAYGIVLNNEHNRDKLAVYNTVAVYDTYFGLDKGTALFKLATEIEVLPLMPGMILNGKLADSQTIAPRQHLAPAAGGKLKEFIFVTTIDDPACDVGQSMSVATSVASLQWIAWMVR